MASTMAEALRECFAELGGIRTKAEIGRWIRQQYPRRWKPGTLIGHLYGTRVNHPLAFEHHPSQPKFLFGHGGDTYELYDAKKHGLFREGKRIPDDTVPSWILVHSPDRYANDEWYDSPEAELSKEFEPNMHWHWKLPRPMKDDERPRSILLAWGQSVFGEATATITRKIGREYRRDFNFAFVLREYLPLTPSIPLSGFQLGKRESQHRSLIRLKPENLAAYRAARRGKAVRTLAEDIPEAVQMEDEIQSGVNPHKSSRQGYGLSPKEKKCVELHAMKIAEQYLSAEGFDVEDVSNGNSFDILATRSEKTVSVEVKGTTGRGAEISLTKKEVQFQRLSHPRNMLIVVHSILLKRGTYPKASGGKLREISPWLLDDEKLTPSAYSYKV